MKALISITALTFSLLVVSGCQKGSNGTAGNYFMTATVGATTFSAKGLSKVYQTSASSGGLNYTYITGKASDGQVIKITIINNSGISLSIRTIPINSGAAAVDYYPRGLDSAYTNAQTGSVVITSIIPNIEGTFSFTCADSTVVSNGAFSVLAQQ